MAVIKKLIKTITDIESFVMEMTPTEAAEWRRLKHFPRQRTIYDSNVMRLAKEMEKDRFTPGIQIYLAVLPDGTEYILNGNHTLEAIVFSGRSQVVCILRKCVADIDEAGLLYATFDDQKRRSFTDAAKAYGLEFEKAYIGHLGSAVNMILQRFMHADGSHFFTMDKHAVVEKAREEYLDAATKYLEAVATGNRQKDISLFVKRAPIMAIGLVTFRYQPSAAWEFWSRFAGDNGLTNGMPEKALLTYLRNMSKDSSGVFARRCQALAAASAWNAFFKKEERAHVRGENAKFFILGTPWEKGVKTATEEAK